MTLLRFRCNKCDQVNEEGLRGGICFTCVDRLPIVGTYVEPGLAVLSNEERIDASMLEGIRVDMEARFNEQRDKWGFAWQTAEHIDLVQGMCKALNENQWVDVALFAAMFLKREKINRGE